MGSRLQIRYSRAGAVREILVDGRNFAVEAKEAFSLELLDRNGNAKLLHSVDFHYDGEKNYSGHPEFPAIRVSLNYSEEAASGKFSPEVTGIPDDWVLEWIDAPQIHYPATLNGFFPWHDGVVISDISKRTVPYHPIRFSRRGEFYGNMFPGRCQLQMMAVFDGTGKGFCLIARDCDAVPKAMECEYSEGNVRLSMQTFTGCDFGESYHSSFDYLVLPLTQGWMEGCLIYRQWFEKHAPAVSDDFPAWMAESPVVVIYPIRGQGCDVGPMPENCYYPYANFLKYADSFNQLFESRILALLMHWEGTAPWAPPYVWPPYGGTEKLVPLRDGLHRAGNLLGVYGSGTAWTCRSCITDYEPGCPSEVRSHMIRGPLGEIDASVCNGIDSQRMGYECCMAEQWPRETVRREIRKLAEFGIDYAQYFDQNHGGGIHNCYARHHRHPPVPGKWQTQAEQSLLQEIHGECRHMVIGCESSAAEPFVNELLLNDARPNFAALWGTPVPAQQFVFHGRSCNFSGNQCGADRVYDFERERDNLLWRLGYAFNAGDLLAVVLKESGRIHWCWGVPWSAEEPDQESIITFVRNLNTVRRKYPQFLLYGKMCIPSVKITGGRYLLHRKNGDHVETESFFQSEWEAPNGDKAFFVTNFLRTSQQVEIQRDLILLPPLNCLTFILKNREIKEMA